MKNVYKIPVDYKMFGDMIVEADSLDEAKEKILLGGILPENPYYMKGSITIDKELLKEYELERPEVNLNRFDEYYLIQVIAVSDSDIEFKLHLTEEEIKNGALNQAFVNEGFSVASDYELNKHGLIFNIYLNGVVVGNMKKELGLEYDIFTK